MTPFAGGALLVCILCAAPAGAAGLKPHPKAGRPECIRRIDLENFGGMAARFGDLDGDGRYEAVFVQADDGKVTCVTALDLDGRRLWQRGTPHERNRTLSSDVAVQVYDWDGDKADEVLVVEGGVLRVLDGATGKVEREAAVPGGNSLLVLNLSGAPRPGELLVKDEYTALWVYDRNLKPLWEGRLNTGHFPLNVDLDGDGRDELLCGYTMFNHDGTVRWAHPEFRDHNDAADADDMDGDGKAEIAIACSNDGVLLGADGSVLWRKAFRHCQHAVIGSFVPDSPGKQVVFVDRVDAGKPEGGIVHCYDRTGRELWRTKPQGGLAAASTIDGWTGEKGRSFVLLYRRWRGPPVLLDGCGGIVVEFPFPPAEEKAGWDQYFVQHFDALGDAREEVFVYSPWALWVYRNAAPPPAGLPEPARGPDPRIYNATFYVGRQ